MKDYKITNQMFVLRSGSLRIGKHRELRSLKRSDWPLVGCGCCRGAKVEFCGQRGTVKRVGETYIVIAWERGVFESTLVLYPFENNVKRCPYCGLEMWDDIPIEKPADYCHHDGPHVCQGGVNAALLRNAMKRIELESEARLHGLHVTGV